MAAAIAERSLRVAGVRTHLLERDGDGIPTVLWHGVPNTAGMWAPWISALDGPVYAADMPGFGRSARPDPALFDGSFRALVDWADRLIGALELERYSLVAHDWGLIGLLAAARRPERVHRIVCLNIVPPEGSYRWHWIARIWRRRGLGEALTSLRSRAGTSLLLRQARPRWRRMPDAMIDDCVAGFDADTKAAILRLYRSADPPALGAAGEALGDLRVPAKVIWGAADPYIPLTYAGWLATALGGAGLEVLDDAGHWPWIDRPDLIGDAAALLAA